MDKVNMENWSWEVLLQIHFNATVGFADESRFLATQELKRRGAVIEDDPRFATGDIIGFTYRSNECSNIKT